jgi:hypothetical protein
MIKITFIAAVISLLAACSSMYSGSPKSSSSSMSNTATMGGPEAMKDGMGPSGSSGGGPN